MKKITTAVLTTVLLVSAASANHTGFFVGLGAVTGAVSAKYQDKPTSATAGSISRDKSFSNDTGKTMFGGRIEAGYGLTFSGCGWAAISVYATLKNTKMIPYSDIGTGNANAALADVRFNSKYNYGVEVKLGYHITKDTVGFIGIAAEATRNQIRWTQVTAQTGSAALLPALTANKTKIYAKPVIGMRTMFTKNLFLEAKYGYGFGSKTTLNVPAVNGGALTAAAYAAGAAVSAGTTTRSVSVRPRTHEFSVTIGWKF